MRKSLLIFACCSVLSSTTLQAQFVTTPAGFPRPATGKSWFKITSATYTSTAENTGDVNGDTRFALPLSSAVSNGCPTIQVQRFASPGSGPCNAENATISSTQSRKVTLNAWTNSNPVSGVAVGASTGIIWSPTSAKIKILGGTGAGGSDATFTVIGGNGGNNRTKLVGTTFWSIGWADSRFAQSGSGAEGNFVFNNDDPTFGMSEPGGGNPNNVKNVGPAGNAYTSEMIIPLNNAQLGAGGTTDVTFTANVGIRDFRRDFGNADGRMGFNPGMKGEAQIEVVYDIFEIRNNPQPVELSDFSLSGEGKSVVAVWETASERENSHFLLERSQDVKSFEAVGRVEGKGTTASISKYVFEDKNPVVGINYYRLRQVDFNGQFAFSAVKSYIVRENGALVVLPNPSDNFLTVNGLMEGSNLQVIDQTGRVRLEKMTENNATTMDIRTLPSGVYFVRIVEVGQSQTLKFIINR